ncbi:hypothetical protein P175DRAFT_0461569, partial [Aspergillus ochraceoroseus IBT 24754]
TQSQPSLKKVVCQSQNNHKQNLRVFKNHHSLHSQNGYVVRFLLTLSVPFIYLAGGPIGGVFNPSWRPLEVESNHHTNLSFFVFSFCLCADDKTYSWRDFLADNEL